MRVIENKNSLSISKIREVLVLTSRTTNIQQSKNVTEDNIYWVNSHF